MQPPLGNFDRVRRRKCISFRDRVLLGVFELGLWALEGSLQGERLPFGVDLLLSPLMYTTLSIYTDVSIYNL